MLRDNKLSQSLAGSFMAITIKTSNVWLTINSIKQLNLLNQNTGTKNLFAIYVENLIIFRKKKVIDTVLIVSMIYAIHVYKI